MIRILLADNHRLLHPSLHTIFSTTNNLILIGQVTNCQQLPQICQEYSPSLVLLSPNVSQCSISQTIDDLKRQDPCLKIAALLSDAEEVDVPSLIDYAIAGIILKSDPPEKLLEAIHTIIQGESWFSAGLMPKLMRLNSPKTHGLTSREIDILNLLTKEKTNIEIAHILNVSERTVRCHLESIYSKLGVTSRVGAGIQAFKLKIISE